MYMRRSNPSPHTSAPRAAKQKRTFSIKKASRGKIDRLRAHAEQQRGNEREREKWKSPAPAVFSAPTAVTLHFVRMAGTHGSLPTPSFAREIGLCADIIYTRTRESARMPSSSFKMRFHAYKYFCYMDEACSTRGQVCVYMRAYQSEVDSSIHFSRDIRAAGERERKST